tara:strand:- start:895 stop:1086 length:192 start_codon:yes stop_codon:yes gene_type:complete
MADKTATAVLGVAPAIGAVTTAGSSVVGTNTFLFDEDDTLGSVLDNLEKCKIMVTDYYANKAT